MFKRFYLSIIILSILSTPCFSEEFSIESVYKQAYVEYPKEEFLVGVGVIDKTGDSFKDKRVAGVFSRLEIAKVIKVKVESELLDITCESSGKTVFGSKEECRNEIKMVVKESVDEFLAGSKIVKEGESGSVVYAIAVMPKTVVVKEIDGNIEEAIGEAKDEIKKAKTGDRDALKKAKEKYIKALVYDKEKEAIEGVKSRSQDVFSELERELEALK